MSYDTVSIAVIGSKPPTLPGKRAWSVTVQINDNEAFEINPLCDPFHEDEYEIFQWYLEDSWDEKFKKAEGSDDHKCVVEAQSKALAKIHRYGKELFEGLGLKDYVFTGQTREIFIENRDTNESIDYLVWEQLSDPILWPNPPKYVSITRIANPSVPRNLSNDCLKPFIILLVVARSFQKDKSDVEYLADKNDASPAQVQAPLMQIISQLRAIRKAYRLELEIVRPGSWEEFKNHLEESGPGYFDLIHFDLHGGPLDSKSVFANSSQIGVRS
jgi:hypothetical protein